MRFKIDWASLPEGTKFTVFALFYSVFEGNFSSTSSRGGAYIWRGDLTESFLRCRLGGLIFGILRYLRSGQCRVRIIVDGSLTFLIPGLPHLKD